MDHHGNIRKASAVWTHSLYALTGATLATGLVWKLVDPLLMQQYGSGAPWWLYALLFARLVYGVFKVLGRDAATVVEEARGEERRAQPETRFLESRPSRI